jgi:Protein of unknown function (DUF3572)
MKLPAYTDAPDDETTALVAIGWIVSEPARADRLLALTGLDADGLRGALADRSTLAAVLGVLIDHEPDLLACAQNTGIAAPRIVAAHQRLL